MKRYVRTRLTFRGEPETIERIRGELETPLGPISLAAVIPPAEGEDLSAIWGTAGEAEETDAVVWRGGTALEYVFDTPAAPPVPVYRKLAERYPEPSMTAEYASEDLGEMCGRWASESGSSGISFSEPEDAFEFACGVWDRDPEEEMQERMADWGEE